MCSIKIRTSKATTPPITTTTPKIANTSKTKISTMIKIIMNRNIGINKVKTKTTKIITKTTHNKNLIKIIIITKSRIPKG